MKVLEFARSTMTFRIDLDRYPARTLSHRPPYALNNARVQLDCVCRITERATGRVHTIALGASCKTEQVGATADLWLLPNGDFVPLLSDDEFMQIKTFARAGMMAQLHPPGSGVQSDRQRSPIDGTFDRAHLDLVERVAELLDGPEAIVQAVLGNEPIVGIHRIASERYEAEIQYPVKTINANERDTIYQTDTGPILFPDLDCPPDELLATDGARLLGARTRPTGRSSSSASPRRSTKALMCTTTPSPSASMGSSTSCTAFGPMAGVVSRRVELPVTA